MTRHLTSRSRKAGLPPGALVYVGKPPVEPVRIRIIDYTPEKLEEREVTDAESCFPYRDSPGTAWVDVYGVHDVALTEALGRHFGLHPLVMEDLLNSSQRPKMEDYDGYLFFILRMLTWREPEGRIGEEQVALVLGDRWVLSFQERPGDILDPLRERMRSAKGRLRERGPDYLAYAIIDSIVDHYFVVLEHVGERLDAVEEKLIADPRPETIRRLHGLKRELLHLRRSVWPLREVLNALLRDESPLVKAETKVYLRDVYDHTIHVIDTLETYRDIAAGLLDVYLTSLNNRMGEVMKVLTIIATIFIPLTFVAGVYGMNFEFMPELEWAWAYPAVLSVMLAMGLGMLVYFRRRGWI